MWITRVSINNPVLAAMAMLALLVLGLFSYSQLRVERLPDVAPPIVTIAIAYPGASPGAVETSVTRVVERAVNGVAGVKQIRSASREGSSQTFVEFTLDTDMDRAVQEVRDKVAMLPPALPEEAKPPTVTRMGWENDLPVVYLSMLGRERSPRELSMLAEQVVLRRLERVGGVGRVDVGGMAVRQVRIELDVQRLIASQLTAADIVTALRRTNTDMAVGLIQGAEADAIVQVEGKIADAKDFRDVVVASAQGRAVRLMDVATVVEREREPTTIARVDGIPAVNFDIYKQQDANIIDTGEGVKDALAELRKELGPGIDLKVIYADSDWTRDSLDGVKRTLVEGALLTVVIVFLFLHSWRSTVITALTLPISVIASFIAVHAFGYTLNFMTMMALSLCIGLLIDDAIIVRENIVRHTRLGVPHRRAALLGTEEIGLAVTATTLTICAVFVPIAFTKGIVGMFFASFGVTVAAAVLVSLFVSFTLDPMLSSVWHDPPAAARWPVLGRLTAGMERSMARLETGYARLLRWVFSARRYRLWWPSIGLWRSVRERRLAALRPRRATLTPRGIVLWIAASSLGLALLLTPLVGTEFMPETDNGFISVRVTLPIDTSLERADRKIAQAEQAIRANPEVSLVSTTIGLGRLGEGRNTANLDIRLRERAQRSRTQKEIENAIRDRLATIPGLQVSIGSRPVNVALLGPDPDTLTAQTARVAARIAEIPGVVDLETSVKPGLPAQAVRLRPLAMQELGLTASDLSVSMRSYVNGEIATYWTAPDGEQVEVEVRLPRDRRTALTDLAGLPVAYAANGTPIQLDSVARFVPIFNPEVINRQDLQRRQVIHANVRDRAAGDVNADVKALLKTIVLPPGYRFDVGGSSRDQDEALADVAWAIALSVIFVYIVLASQFGSFLQPLAIMATLPLALIGVVLSLLLTGSTLNLFSMIGLIMLMGLVTKNGILLVDCANLARRAGAGVTEALQQAGTTRLRPILMTTAAMVLGMLPLALALDESGELQSAMGRAIIGGVLASTLLTLVVVPVLYSYLGRASAVAQPHAALPDSEPAGA
ncbi:multidrug efflux pump subunit AcrB [Pseudoduganella flava]|uniref:MMPL family transporter n=1 Tax=Pseudoduganella flava TaxID=871742 RepID=A0A562PHV1_9BURK|nr:efflux RND transporter permease subunit [Pseudoduganella flava]QGZ37678.1 MMPL family transporter [Pseudoduganella flava]TWI43958.1 multidrug efflux pump subunit AcrB [Pseudoduganella flava]